MTPEEFVLFVESVQQEIRKLEDRIEDGRAHVDGTLPDDVRPATPTDITVGRIVWHTDGDEGVFWNVIQEVQYPNDDWKAYVADDGCRYGLRNAFVRAERSSIST